jgi:hypothetical protein
LFATLKQSSLALTPATVGAHDDVNASVRPANLKRSRGDADARCPGKTRALKIDEDFFGRSWGRAYASGISGASGLWRAIQNKTANSMLLKLRLN